VVNASDLKAVTPGNQLCKFADDTYLVIPASNVDLRATEIDNIETWARTNNLTLNRNKSKEIVFSDPRRRRQIEPPPPTTDIARVTSLKIFGVTMTNGLSASDHVLDVIRSCAQTLYELRVLRVHGMCHAALQAIFRSVAIAKLLCASSAWIGFTKATDWRGTDKRQKATETKGHRTQRQDATELSSCARTTTSGFKNSGTNCTLCFICASM